MQDLFTALALVLVVEGVLWALFPERMRDAAAKAAGIDPARLRSGGLAFAALGVLCVWLIRG
jgi:uncharacterized protein YjeT (DUF2065 family)